MPAAVRVPSFAIALLSLAACAPRAPDGEELVRRRLAVLGAFDAGTVAEVDCTRALDAGLACEKDCGDPETFGNERGVGMHCTIGGGECQANGFAAAFLCILDQRPEEFPVCTKPCQYDDECGSGAFCASETPGSLAGCLPRNCAPDHPGAPRPGADAGADAGADVDGGIGPDAGEAVDAGT